MVRHHSRKLYGFFTIAFHNAVVVFDSKDTVISLIFAGTIRYTTIPSLEILRCPKAVRFSISCFWLLNIWSSLEMIMHKVLQRSERLARWDLDYQNNYVCEAFVMPRTVTFGPRSDCVGFYRLKENHLIENRAILINIGKSRRSVFRWFVLCIPDLYSIKSKKLNNKNTSKNLITLV